MESTIIGQVEEDGNQIFLYEYRIKPDPIVKLLNMYYDTEQGLCVDAGRDFNHNLRVEIDPNDDSIISVDYVRKTDG